MQFRSRIDFADRNFSSTLERGILTDRGRVFVRYGEPDDRITEYSSSGFREDGLREQVTNPGERIALQSLPSAEFRGRGDPSDELSRSLSSQRGGTTIKSKELIVWIYDGPGQELRDRRTVDQRAHRGLKFIFADEFGSGDFHLVSSEGGPGH
jgi:GWxTD domain-containing protein